MPIAVTKRFEKVRSNPRFFTFVISLIILLIRAYPRFKANDLYAEEGSIFFAQAFNVGVSTLVHSYAGYFHLLPRVMALFAAILMPWRWIPHFFFLGSIVVASYCFSILASAKYERIFGSVLSRVILCLGFCFISGLREVVGNLTNLHWLLFLGTEFILISGVEDPLSVEEVVFCIVTFTSEGAAVLLLPQLIYRYARRLKLMKSLWQVELFLSLALVTMLAANFLSPQITSSEPGTMGVFNFLGSLISGFFRMQILAPIVGPPGGQFLERASSILYYSVGALLSGVLMLTVVKGERRNRADLIAFFLLGSLLLATIIMVRPGAGSCFFPVFDNWIFTTRYAFVPSAVGWVIWFVCIKSWAIRINVKANVLIHVVLALGMAHAYLGLHKGPWFPAYRYKASTWERYEGTVRLMKSECSPSKIDIPIAPEGWVVSLSSNRVRCR